MKDRRQAELVAAIEKALNQLDMAGVRVRTRQDWLNNSCIQQAKAVLTAALPYPVAPVAELLDEMPVEEI